MCNTERIIRHCIQEKVSLTLVVNKVDRLILELKLPPTDAYLKLKNIIEDVNSIISQTPGGKDIRLSPELGNVTFASSQMGWCFSLKSFAKLYADSYRKLGRACLWYLVLDSVGSKQRQITLLVFYHPFPNTFFLKL